MVKRFLYITGIVLLLLQGQYAEAATNAPPAPNTVAVSIVGQTSTTNNIVSFHQTTTLSSAVLPSNSYSNGVALKSLSSNTGTIYIGQAGVSATTGYPLAPGEAISYGAANSNQVYMIGTNTTDVLAGTGN